MLSNAIETVVLVASFQAALGHEALWKEFVLPSVAVVTFSQSRHLKLS
jgi:hypothetical protein